MKRRLEPDASLWRGATDFERRILTAMAADRPSAAMRARMQNGLGLIAPPIALLSDRRWGYEPRPQKPNAPS